MTMVTATVSGFDRVMAKLQTVLASDLQRATEQAVFTEAQFVVTESIPITPVDTGNLRNSFVVDAPRTEGNMTTVTIRNVSDYALYVHEIPKNYRLGDYKYLTRALERRSAGMSERMHTMIANNLDVIEKGGNQ